MHTSVVMSIPRYFSKNHYLLFEFIFFLLFSFSLTPWNQSCFGHLCFQIKLSKSVFCLITVVVFVAPPLADGTSSSMLIDPQQKPLGIPAKVAHLRQAYVTYNSMWQRNKGERSDSAGTRQTQEGWRDHFTWHHESNEEQTPGGAALLPLPLPEQIPARFLGRANGRRSVRCGLTLPVVNRITGKTWSGSRPECRKASA